MGDTDAFNPFHWRAMITAPGAFIGRERELREILSRLQGLGCTSVVGNRRIGKSSLLYEACRRAADGNWSDLRGVYVDALSAKHHSLEGLLAAVVEGLGGECAGVLAGSSAEALAEFEKAVEEVRDSGCMPVVFLDEFEHLAAHVERFGDDVLESWRSLCNRHQMAFVTASQRSLDQLTGASGWTSTFYGIFSQVRLAEYTATEAEQFAQWAIREGGFDTSDGEFILKTGKRHPLRLQVAAWHLFEAKRDAEPDFGDVQKRVNDDMGAMLGLGSDG